MTTFLVLGGVGVVLLLVSLVVGDLFDLDFGGDFEIGGFDTDIFSTAGIAGLVGGFGFGGALALEWTGLIWAAIGIGLVVGLILAFVAGSLTARLKRDYPGAGASTKALVGSEADVLAPIPADGYGQVRLSHAGHRVTLNAKSDEQIAAGERVWVSAVLSPTAVQVGRVGSPLELPGQPPEPGPDPGSGEAPSGR